MIPGLRMRVWVTILIITQLVFSFLIPTNAAAFAASNQVAPLQGGAEAPVLLDPTTLSVTIRSTPWAALDSNDPANLNTPHVYVVQARVTNIGTRPAADVVVTLDYVPDVANNWVLLPGEITHRTIDSLAPGASYDVYWFARYSSVIGASHLYTVSASADNAPLVSTSQNANGNPEPGKTIKTISTLSTGNSGLTQVSANIVVGVAFTITVGYDLGSNPINVAFSPVGNIDFNAGAYRLLSSSVRFYNDAGTWQSTVPNQLYFPGPLDSRAENAQALFTFIALKAANTRLCTYAAVGYNSNSKYDQFYCDQFRNTIIPIEGNLSLAMTKQVSSATILQGQTLGYTIEYTNTGQLPLSYTWIWDDVNTAIGSVDVNTIQPPYELDETTASRVAWYLGDVPASGQAGSTGQQSFSFIIDGSGQDLVDGTTLVNLASFGINPGSLPATAALTSTTTTTVQAPVISFQNSDGQAAAQQAGGLTYTIQVANSGSALAAGLVITDVLPAGVTLAGSPTPAPNTTNGKTLVWNSLSSLAAGGGATTISIPVTVDMKTPNGTVLHNAATLQYQNAAGYIYTRKTASDQTTVAAPVLTISKSASPNPVLTGKVILYTLSYANTGPAGATQVVITDQVPANTTYQSCSGGASCSQTAGVVTWNVGSVAAGGSGSVSFSVLVDADLNTGDIITNATYAILSDQTAAAAGPAVNTSVNRDAAVIEGVAFRDNNGNGVYDTGDELLKNVDIALPGAVASPIQTDDLGKFNFRVETEGMVTITAGDVANHFHTTPPVVQLIATLGVTQTVNFGYSNSSLFGVIFGTVFEDANTDGVQAPGELGLAGVQIAPNSAAPLPVTTNAYGQYTLRFDSAGSFSIVETNPAGYISTTPDTVNVNVVTGSSSSSPVDFGDFQGIKISGQVFHDQNVNGAKDAGESGLAGAVVAANGQQYTTSGDGAYVLFVALGGPGPVQITETDPAGYVSTNAIPGTGMVWLNSNMLQISAPVAGTSYTDGSFGDALASGVVTIQGQVWDDNGAGGGGLANGVKDGSEAGLAGVVVSLSSGLSHTTDASGNFTLFAPANQATTLSEQNPTGYVSTNAIAGVNASKLNNDQIQINALSGGATVSGNLFGDVMAGSVALISGVVFDDQDEDGIRDAGETGMSGVKVTLQTSQGGSIEVTTGMAGDYQFAARPGVDLIISSTGPAGGYYPTTPQSLNMHLATGGIYPNNNFGYSNDTDSTVITGWVFDDRNSNGEPDFGELGLAGAKIWLDELFSITTSGNGVITGTFTFKVPAATAAPAIHHLRSVNTPDYRSTTPDDLNVVVVPGTYSYYVEFGDTNAGVASIYGTAFDDKNSNGIQDLNEAGLPGVTISVTVGGGSNVVTAVTKSYGQFTYGLDIYESGYHTVSEQDPAKPGYHSTTPDAVNVYVTLGKSYIVNFGDSTSGYVVMGTVFDDQNVDGTQDAAEVGLPNVSVALSNGATTHTNPNGGYTIPLAAPASTPYIVRVLETDPAGYHSTTPNEVPIRVVETRPVYGVNFGDDNNPFITSIFGTVFNDVNANAAYDHELGLAGVAVKLSNDQAYDFIAQEFEYVTNEWGQYTFHVELIGEYTLIETDLAGWVSTAAIPGSAATWIDNNTLHFQVNELGAGLSSNLFGDVQADTIVSIAGFVWDDNGSGGGVLADGLRSGTEPGLPGALVSLSSGMKQTSGADGAFVLYGPPNMGLTVVETNPTGYLSTGAVPGSSAVKVDRDTLQVSPLSASSGSTGNLFGDVSSSGVTVIQGKVFNDQNGNGLRDTGEAGIPGVQVALDGSAQRTTDATGFYEFITPAGGGHVVTETDPAGYFSTMPNSVFVDTVLGKTYTIDFGDALNSAGFASIFGTVYEDTNNNTQRDTGEPGIMGVSIKLDNGPSVVTDLYGRYTFATQTAGQHQVVETDLIDYASTTPNVRQVTVALGHGYQVDFGDRLICSCTKDSFEDDNTPEQAKGILFGAVNLHACNFCTDANDWLSFTAQAGATYTITTSAIGVRADTYLQLFDGDGKTELAANDDYAGTTNFSSRIVWQTPVAGKYYVKVTNRSSLVRCSTDYTVQISEAVKPLEPFHALYFPVMLRPSDKGMAKPLLRQSVPQGLLFPSGEISHSCPDAYEVDDTWETASPLASGVPQVHSFDSNPAQYASDKDLVSFQISAGDVITFTTQVTNTVTRLELFGDNGAALHVTGTNQLRWEAPADGTYYLSISPLTNVFGCSNTVGYKLFSTLVNKVDTTKRIWLPVIVR